MNYEDANDCFDWEVGKHGIIIEFSVGKVQYHATFLPEVAAEQNWTKRDTLRQLIAKSGYFGHAEDVYDDIKLVRYESVKLGCTYDDWKNSQ
ncbi:hypothetical protein GEMRC1_014189 [Eukaryota sp. GEM-RC1]